MTYLSDGLTRIVAMQKEAVSGSNAVPVFFWEQSNFPYWTNRIGPITNELDSQEVRIRTHQIVMRLVIGHLTEGYDTILEQQLSTYIPNIMGYFDSRIYLNSAAYPLQMDDLDARGALLTDCTGLQIFEQGGVGSQQIGVEFTLELPFKVYITQAY